MCHKDAYQRIKFHGHVFNFAYEMTEKRRKTDDVAFSNALFDPCNFRMSK